MHMNKLSCAFSGGALKIKKILLPFALVLALCLGLAVPALAVDSTTANLTPQIAKAYKDIVDSLYREYGSPIDTKETWENSAVYYGMCGGYVVDLGDGGSPEMIVAYSKKSSSSIIDIPSSYIKVYTWNGTKAVMVFEYQVLASLNGRSWNTYTLCQNGNTAWLEVKWESLPDAFTGIEYEPELVHCHVENGVMKGFTPQTKASSSARLGSFDYITLNNYDEFRTLLTNAANATSATVGGFTDVKTGDWFAEPVKWAVGRGITTGTSVTTFSPNNTCTKAHILTFLWRAKGEPMPTVTNPFSDVKDRSYYYNAALWAYENGLVSGSSFKPDSPCTRAQTVTYQWKLAGSPAAPAAAFTDVSSTADYAAAVAWAVEKGITTGTSATTFSPNDTCTRGQIVTFLYRDMGGSPADTDSTSNTQLMAQAMLDKLNALGDPEAYLLDMNTDGTPELVCYDKEIPDATWSEGYRVYRWDGRKLYEHQFDYSYDYGTHEKNYGQGITKCHDGYALVYPIIGGHEGGEYVYFLDHTDTFYYGWDEYWDGEGDGEDEAFWTFNGEEIGKQRYKQLVKEYGLEEINWHVDDPDLFPPILDLPDARTELNKLLAG